jgi:general stress protein YciG
VTSRYPSRISRRSADMQLTLLLTGCTAERLAGFTARFAGRIIPRAARGRREEAGGGERGAVVSAKAIKAVEDALIVAAALTAEGRNREAEIIRRVCKSNTSYRSTLGQLWRDNMALRGLPTSLDDAEAGEDRLSAAASEMGRMGGLVGGKARADALSPERRAEIARKGAEARWGKKFEVPDALPSGLHDDEAAAPEPGMSWCAQCERRVTAGKAASCLSPFCKAKAEAA